MEQKKLTWKKLKISIAVYLTENLYQRCRLFETRGNLIEIFKLGVKTRFLQFPEDKLCILEDELIFRFKEKPIEARVDFISTFEPLS